MFGSRILVSMAFFAGGVALFSAPHAAAATPADWAAAFGEGVKKLPPSGKADRPPPVAPQAQKTLPVAATRPIQAAPTDRASEIQVRSDARSLATTFTAAVEAKSSAFNGMSEISMVVDALTQGVRGGGQFSSAMFRVPGLSPERKAAAVGRLRIERGMLVVAHAGGAAARPKDDLTSFADGKLKLRVPKNFVAEEQKGGDLLLRADGASIRVHLAAYGAAGTGWALVRKSAASAGNGVSMSGDKVYLLSPDRRHPERATVGFGPAVVEIHIEGDPLSPGFTHVRFALATMIESLALAD